MCMYSAFWLSDWVFALAFRAQRILHQLAAVTLLTLVITVYDIVVRVDCGGTSNMLHDHDAAAKVYCLMDVCALFLA